MKQQKNVDTDIETTTSTTTGEVFVASTGPSPKTAGKPPKLIQGFEWSQLPGVDERLEECLWNAGIVTIEHLSTNPQAAIGALMAYHALDLAALRHKAKEFNDGKQ